MIYKPIGLLPDNEFYAIGKPITISWRNSGGVMRSFRIKIWDNSSTDPSPIFDSFEIASTSPAYIVDSNDLGLGEFKYTVTVYDDANQQNENRNSAESTSKLFTISPVPTLTLNLVPDSVYSLQVFSISAQYTHPTGIKAKNYKFVLFDRNKNVLEESAWISDNNFEYTFTTLLENKETYYTQCLVVTLDNIEAATDIVKFIAEYVKPSVHFALEATTEPCKPYVILKWSVVRVVGELIGDGYFIDINNNAVPDENLAIDAEKLNLLNEGAMAVFREGFSIESDFTLNLWVEDIQDGVTFFVMENSNGQQIYLNYYQNRIHAWKPMEIYTVHAASDEINYTGTEQIMIRLQQVNNRIDVFAMIVE